LLAALLSSEMTFLTSTSILTPDHFLPAIFVSSVGPVWYEVCGVSKPNLPAPGVWNHADLKPIGVPANAVAVDLRGILIITDGANSGDTSIGVGFQTPGDSKPVGNYAMQTCAVGPTGGSRSNGSAIVPCVNGCIQWFWYRGNVGEWPANPLLAQYPAGASYGFNLDIHAIYMP
jgi:hypothetical protein